MGNSISIHALLAESDNRTKTVAAEVGDFYPRSPCGERRVAESADTGDKVFLSTLSLRRATYQDKLSLPPAQISIHALLAESDTLLGWLRVLEVTHFYPRSPCGERLNPYKLTMIFGNISIHALLAESDWAVDRNM